MLPIAALSSVIFSGIRAVTGNGDLTPLWIALGIGFVGAAVFFVARLSQSTKEKELSDHGSKDHD
jgi:hypothetical protein